MEYRDIDQLERWLKDHQQFLAKYEDDVGLHITDTDFGNRFILAEKAVMDWLQVPSR